MKIICIIVFSLLVSSITFAKPKTTTQPVEYKCHVLIQPTDLDRDYFVCNVNDLQVWFEADTGNLYLKNISLTTAFEGTFILKGVFDGQLVSDTKTNFLIIASGGNGKVYLTVNGDDFDYGIFDNNDYIKAHAIHFYGGKYIENQPSTVELYTGTINAVKTIVDSGNPIKSASLAVDVDLFEYTYAWNS